MIIITILMKDDNDDRDFDDELIYKSMNEGGRMVSGMLGGSIE